jgi:ankyrin repeat protein
LISRFISNLRQALPGILLVAALYGLASSAKADIYNDLLKAIEERDTATVTSILQRGMDVNTVDSSGNTLLMLATGNGNKELVEFLLSHRARVRARNRYGDTALMTAALKGHLVIARLLVTAGAEINHSGWTPLIYAAFEGREETLKYLLEHGAEVNALAPNGSTALMVAARNGHIQTVKLLLEADADTDVKTSDGATALKWAREGLHPEIAELLRTTGAKE